MAEPDGALHGLRALRAETVGGTVRTLAEVLAGAGVPEAAAEARDIVAALLDQPRFWPSVNRELPLDAATRATAVDAATRRAAGAPFPYAVGRAPFRHLTLDVDERVLIPRQETELLVDIVLESAGAGGTVADVGTGSGAIAFALACEGRYGRVVATDISLDALAVARRNAALLARALRAPVEIRHGSLLAPLAGERVGAIVSNPPYIAASEAADLPASVRDWEPAVALFGGPHGLDVTAALVRAAPDHLVAGGLLTLEVDCRRASTVAELAASDGRYGEVGVRLDLTGRERFVIARRR